jgi:hypothetical protein
LTACSRCEFASSPDKRLFPFPITCTQSRHGPDGVCRQQGQFCAVPRTITLRPSDVMDDIHGLRRQTGRAVLKKRADDCNSDVYDSRLSLQATCGSLPELLDLSATTLDDVISTRVREFVVAATAAIEPAEDRRRISVNRKQRRHTNDVTDCNGNDVKKCRTSTNTRKNIPVHISNTPCDKRVGRRMNPSLLGYGCLTTRNYNKYVTRAMEKERQRRQVAAACRRAEMGDLSRKRSLVKRLKRFSNILCTSSGATADCTHTVRTLGHF